MVDPKQCLFCRIVKGEIPAQKVYEDTETLAFLDINPRNPGHTLVIPKKHIETLMELPDRDIAAYFAAVKRVAVQVKEGTNAHGLSICQNNGSAAGQVVAHLHFHLIPRFLNEGPPALEALLPVKKMDQEALDQVAAQVKSADVPSDEPALVREPVPEPDPEPEEEPEPPQEEPAEPPQEEEPKPPAKKKKKKAPKPEDDDDMDEFEEIDFNL